MDRVLQQQLLRYVVCMELANIFACKETRSADGKEIFFILGSTYLNHPHFRFIFPSDINILENNLARIPLAGRSLSKRRAASHCSRLTATPD